MIGLLCFVAAVLASPLKSKIRLEAENATLRHQLVVLRRFEFFNTIGAKRTFACCLMFAGMRACNLESMGFDLDWFISDVINFPSAR
jgi:hypothetical protein